MLLRFLEDNRYLSILKRYMFILTLVPWYLFQMCYIGNIMILGRHPVYLEARFDQLVIIVLAVQILLFQRYSWKQLAFILPLTVIFYASSRISYTFSLFYGWLFILASKDQDLDLAVKLVCGVLIAMTAVIFAIYFAGVHPENILTNSSGRLRHSWGFSHPNALGLTFLQITACRTYIRRNRLSFSDLVLAAASTGFVWLVPYSRSSIICLLMITALTAYCLIGKKLPDWAKKTVMALMVVLALAANIFSVAASLGYHKSPVFSFLNKVLTHRLSYAKKAYKIFGVSLFGQFLPDGFTTFQHNGKEYTMPYIDSAYMVLLLKFGVLSYLGYSAVYLTAMVRKWLSREQVLLGILAVFALHSVMEPSLLELRYNVFMLFLCCIFVRNREQNRP